MANYSQVSYGSQGSDVTELQKLLNNNGYKLDVDGIFGSKTQAAVKDYQQKNSLAVDGIVGEKTWGSLTGNVSVKTPSEMPEKQSGAAVTTTSVEAPTAQNTEYKPSDAVTQAEALLNQQLSQKPGAYQSTWQDQLNDTISKILNREKFSYDLNGDALYQQYKDQYTTQGKMAMMDTIGQAQAMTGGYGNSYAQNVGQQTYQGYLQQLNDVVPELYQMALDQYNQEGQDLYNQYALLGEQENLDYARYQDQLNDWNAERDYLTGRYDAERDYDYNQYWNDLNYQYQQERDKVSDEQWQKEYDFALRQYNDSQSSSGSSGTSSGGGSGGGSYDDGGLDKDQIKEMQDWYGTSADGIWGDKSTEAADGRSVTEAWEYYQANKDKTPEPVSGFNGTTDKEAVEYMIANGVPDTDAYRVMRESEWRRSRETYEKTGKGGPEVRDNSSYQEYLRDFVAGAVSYYNS